MGGMGDRAEVDLAVRVTDREPDIAVGSVRDTEGSARTADWQRRELLSGRIVLADRRVGFIGEPDRLPSAPAVIL